MKGLAAIVTRVSPDPKQELSVEQEERIALQVLMFLVREPQHRKAMSASG